MPPTPDEPFRHVWVWVVYAVLFALAIPWYFPGGRPEPIWLGFPRWVAVSLGATLAIAGFTAYVIERYWSEDEE
jgi:hypothetical protein